MEYVLLILISLVNGYTDLGLLWSQILLVPGLMLSYSIGFGKAKQLYDNSECLWGARILLVIYVVQELALVYEAVESLFAD